MRSARTNILNSLTPTSSTPSWPKASSKARRTRANPPANTWAGNLALWHEHDGLCLVGTKSASEGETPESCKAKGGSYTAALKWMMHVWVAPGHDNPTGVFSYLNNELFQKQQAAGNTGGAGAAAERDDRAVVSR